MVSHLEYERNQVNQEPNGKQEVAKFQKPGTEQEPRSGYCPKTRNQNQTRNQTRKFRPLFLVSPIILVKTKKFLLKGRNFLA